MDNRKLDRIISESIKRVLNESFASSKLRNFFQSHGGVKKIENINGSNTLIHQDGLSNITDDAISYYQEFDNTNMAINKYHSLMKSNNGYRSEADRNNVFYIFDAKDGAALLIGTYSNLGDFSQDARERHMRNGWNHKTRDDRYVEDNTYHWGGGSDIRSGCFYDSQTPGNDFGIYTSDDYKRKLKFNKDNREKLSKDDEALDREYSLNRMRGHVKKHFNKDWLGKNYDRILDRNK